jgi:hypothetical protein
MRRLLPHGPLDLLRQFALFAAAYMLYRLVRGLVDGRAAVAFDNARDLVAFEQSLDLFVEPAVHAWASGQAWVIDTTSWLYVNSHFTLTFATLAYIYLRRNRSFYFVRNMFMVSMAIALVGYAVFPTAPPRFMREWGFRDSVAELTGNATNTADVLYNAYAAVPSMHVAFALMIGLAMARMVRRGWAKALWCAYPGLVTFVVVATANHWWMDAFLGALTAAVAALVAKGFFARVRPAAWAWPAHPGVAA